MDDERSGIRNRLRQTHESQMYSTFVYTVKYFLLNLSQRCMYQKKFKVLYALLFSHGWYQITILMWC